MVIGHNSAPGIGLRVLRLRLGSKLYIIVKITQADPKGKLIVFLNLLVYILRVPVQCT
jgi:hypothetical protein